jgi:serine phosphatase RsbU (regulator of sigma subunit)
LIIVAADCTGHGVPGALLSLIGNSLVQNAVKDGLSDPAKILDSAREGMINTLYAGGEQPDGMNASVISMAADRSELLYAGAYGPLYLIRQGKILEFKGDRMSIGHQDQGMKAFSTERISLQSGDRFYLFSDGLQDQFGGPNGKKLRSSGLRQWLIETAHFPIEEQHQAISDRFRQWKGALEQVDDVLLIGCEI